MQGKIPNEERLTEFRLFIDTPWPKCQKPVKVCAIELHRAGHQLAIQYFQCADCVDAEAHRQQFTL